MKPIYRFQVFAAENAEWCWRCVHRNGKELSRASETYKQRSACMRILKRMLVGVKAGEFVIEDAKA